MKVHDEKSTTPGKPVIEKSRELQRKLYLAAKRSRNRRFHALYDRLYRPDVLWRAWCEVKAKKGAGGVDGLSFEDIENEGLEEFLSSISKELREKVYKPGPVLRVLIPKSDGSKRPLGIPTIKDRVVQQACKIVIEPVFEANFQENSYGFRPGKGAIDAVKKVRESLVRNWWALDMDIKGFFDSIDHERLINLVKRRISDRRVLKLINLWLKAGVVVEGKYETTNTGSPQGGVISPLLANIYLHVFDMYWNTRCAKLGKLIRYADDCVILCRYKEDVEKSLALVSTFMKYLKLELHPVKTKVVKMETDGFDFLGYYFRKSRSKTTGKIVPYCWPSQKSMKAIRQKIKEATGREMHRLTPEMIVNTLKPIVRGWRNYFEFGNSTKKLHELDFFMRWRLFRFCRKCNGNRYKISKKRFADWYFDYSGIEHFYKYGSKGYIP